MQKFKKVQETYAPWKASTVTTDGGTHTQQSRGLSQRDRCNLTTAGGQYTTACKQEFEKGLAKRSVAESCRKKLQKDDNEARDDDELGNTKKRARI